MARSSFMADGPQSIFRHGNTQISKSQSLCATSNTYWGKTYCSVYALWQPVPNFVQPKVPEPFKKCLMEICSRANGGSARSGAKACCLTHPTKLLLPRYEALFVLELCLQKKAVRGKANGCYLIVGWFFVTELARVSLAKLKSQAGRKSGDFRYLQTGNSIEGNRLQQIFHFIAFLSQFLHGGVHF